MGIGPTVLEKDVPCLQKIWEFEKRLKGILGELQELKETIVRIR